MHPDEVIECANLYHDQVSRIPDQPLWHYCFSNHLTFSNPTTPLLPLALKNTDLIVEAATNDFRREFEQASLPRIAGDFTIVR